MSDRWDFRAVEGVLYGLGRASARAAMAPPSPATVDVRQSSTPSSQVLRDVDPSVARSLSPDEVVDIRDHYILGIRRQGYKRRAQIIKKLVDELNQDAGVDSSGT